MGKYNEALDRVVGLMMSTMPRQQSSIIELTF